MCVCVHTCTCILLYFYTSVNMWLLNSEKFLGTNSTSWVLILVEPEVSWDRVTILCNCQFLSITPEKPMLIWVHRSVNQCSKEVKSLFLSFVSLNYFLPPKEKLLNTMAFFAQWLKSVNMQLTSVSKLAIFSLNSTIWNWDYIDKA